LTTSHNLAFRTSHEIALRAALYSNRGWDLSGLGQTNAWIVAVTPESLRRNFETCSDTTFIQLLGDKSKIQLN